MADTRNHSHKHGYTNTHAAQNLRIRKVYFYCDAKDTILSGEFPFPDPQNPNFQHSVHPMNFVLFSSKQLQMQLILEYGSLQNC